MSKILVIIILFLSTSNLNADERDVELDKLFLELKKDIPSLSSRIAQQIWMLWSTHPTDQKLTSLLDEGSRLVQDQQYNRAIDVFTEAIKLDPTWAEAWNKRATEKNSVKCVWGDAFESIKSVGDDVYDHIFVDLNDDQFCIDLAAKNMDLLVRILKNSFAISLVMKKKNSSRLSLHQS